MLNFNISNLPPELISIAEDLLPMLNATYSNDTGMHLQCCIDPDLEMLTVQAYEDKVEINAPKVVLFARALSITVELYQESLPAHRQEPINYPRLEAMVDCARNAVPTVEALKKFIRHMALMGYTGLQLYVEDVFELEDYPYFGYMRGAYTKAELQGIEQECDKFGIELIPCIQTLAHLGKALRWQCFHDITDFDDILLVDEPKTYALIEAMIRTMAETLKSRSINLGMDEAHMLGLGKYLDKHGYQDRIQIMLEHFRKVKAIADKYGYQVMIWSDMFFRLLNSGNYENNQLEKTDKYAQLRSQIPEGMELIYWNYYTEDQKVYDEILDYHKQMSDNIGFAGGAWRWTSFSPCNTFSLHVSPPAHRACLNQNIKHILVTSWGDDGGETSLFAVLPSFLYWAEACYSIHDTVNEQQLRRRFSTCTGCNWDDFLLLDKVLLSPENPPYQLCIASPSKNYLYQDILCGLFDRHISPLDKPHYEKAALELAAAAPRNPKFEILFQVQVALAKLLAQKVNLGLEIRQAYRSQEKNKLQHYAEVDLPTLLTRIEDFIQVYDRQWQMENKIFGLDVFDIRMGALKERIIRAQKRIEQYLRGEIAIIEELEQNILYYDCRDEEDKTLPLIPSEYLWMNIVTTSHSRNTSSY